MTSRRNAVENGMATPIPIGAAKRIADIYGYDQIVIVARKVGDNGSEHVTTYGVDKANCEVAARTGDFLKYKIMGWREGGQNPVVTPTKPPAYKYPETFCSQCGGEFGPGNEGFSHCENHKHLPRIG